MAMKAFDMTRPLVSCIIHTCTYLLNNYKYWVSVVYMLINQAFIYLLPKCMHKYLVSELQITYVPGIGHSAPPITV